MDIPGVGPDAPTVVNENGAGQSKLPYRFDLLDPPALFAMTEVLATGAEKYGENNWRQLDIPSHLNHLLVHVFAYLAGDTSDDHLSHILCRAMFAYGVHAQEDKDDDLMRKVQEAKDQARMDMDTVTNVPPGMAGN